MRIYLNATSNAPLRVRIALALKGMRVEEIHVDLDKDAQHAEAFRRINPQEMIPVLADGDRVIAQSLAIIEYIEEIQPLPPLLPRDAAGRARVRALALVMACDGQPLLNLRVRQYLQGQFGLGDEHLAEWMRHWMQRSLGEVEALLARDPVPGIFAHGDQPTLADVCLVPQVLMAQRFGIGLGAAPRVMEVFGAAMALPQVAAAVASGQAAPAAVGTAVLSAR